MSDTKQVIVMRKDLNMRKGKMVAQGSHASLAVVLMIQEMHYGQNTCDWSKLTPADVEEARQRIANDPVASALLDKVAERQQSE